MTGARTADQPLHSEFRVSDAPSDLRSPTRYSSRAPLSRPAVRVQYAHAGRVQRFPAG